ncbi:MAG: carbamoyltransferase HypF [Blastocatellia bacterium]|nr:carbamoyltransferase HypF [Blastocatellia bacterium]
MKETDLNRGRLRFTVRGVVQGVGFRPFVYGCATRLGLRGLVGNASGGVFIEVEGSREALTRFHRELLESPPPLSHLEEVTVEEIPATGDDRFLIVGSESAPGAHTLVSPDIAVCAECLRELLDPGDRRYRYPFINCTNCGPRFTITKEVPYDRPRTTMAEFTMCAPCRREYDDPLDRRFHAQPNACAECGPRIEFVNGETRERGEAALLAVQRLLRAGGIAAIKGIGGFHLACDARNDESVARLRERKGRGDKPFAVMARDLATARRFAEIDDREAALLTGRERPILLLRKRLPEPLSTRIAPGNDYIGVMLPYAPLHHLLLDDEALDALVMTSGNLSDEPIAKENDEALERLGALADAFLLHDRGIHVSCDDSVARIFEGHELPIRRSRGYAPFPVKLPFPLRPTLAVGGELKNAFCLINGDHAIMSQHIGDMENLETLRAFEDSIRNLKSLFRVEPELLAADRHPGYLSTRWARANRATVSSQPAQYVEVQHHHAHIAAVMVENGHRGETPVLGFSFDGTGYGDDGMIWGGELLLADYRGYRRLAHLGYFPLPGGDAAIKRPYRTALAALWAAGIDWNGALPPVAACPELERRILRKQLEADLNCISTSSMGRLFDAVASLAGVRQTVAYEAQAAIEFEALAAQDVGAYAFDLLDGGAEKPTRIDSAPVLRAAAADILDGLSPAILSGRFHQAVSDLILRLAEKMAKREGIRQVALSGGVFQNVRLLGMAVAQLRAAGFEVFTHRATPPNDGGLALGQAVIANFAPTPEPGAPRPRRARCH